MRSSFSKRFLDRKQGAVLATGLCGLLVGAAVPAHADVLFNDDFQTDTAGTQPTTDELNPAIQTGDIGDRWEIRDHGDQVVQVINNSTPGVDGIAGSNHYVSMRRTSDNRSELTGYLNFSDADNNTFDDATYNNTQVNTTFRLFLPTGNDEAVVAESQGNGVGGSTSWQIRVDPDGNVISYDAGTSTDTGLDVSLGDWSDFFIKENLDSSKYDLTVDGQTVTGLDNDGYAVDYANTFFTERPGDSIQYYIDDVAVSTGPVPEPASAALLGVGGALMMFRRRGAHA